MGVCIEQYRMVIGLFVRARFGKMLTFGIFGNFALFIGYSFLANLNIAYCIIVIFLLQMCDKEIQTQFNTITIIVLTGI